MKCRVCNKEKELTKGICQECLVSNNKTFELNNLPRSVYILHCPNDGLYLGSHNTNRCPICNKRLAIKCKNCGEWLESNFSICQECGYNPAEYNKYLCAQCGKQIKSSGSICESCGYNPHDHYNIQCPECGNKLKNTLETCSKCGYNPQDNFNILCKQCGSKKNSFLETCKQCGYNPSKNFEYYCKNCNQPIENINSKCKHCGYTPSEHYNYKCKNCGNILKNPNLKCNKCGYNPKDNVEYACPECGNKLKNNFQICDKCGYHPNNHFNTICPKCDHKMKSPTSICDNCGYNPHNHYIIQCKNCGEQIKSIGSICQSCGYNPYFSKRFKCKYCGNDIPGLNVQCPECGKYNSDNFRSNFVTKDSVLYYKDTEIHELIRQLDNNEIEIPLGFEKRLGSWTYNKLDLLTNEKILLNHNNFVTKDSVLYYKNTEIHELIRQLDNNEIEIPSGFEKRLGSWTYNRLDVLTNEKILLNNSNFVENKNVVFVLDHLTNSYVEWDKFKIDYEENVNLIENSQIYKNILKEYPNALVVPTYITNIEKDNPESRYMEGLGIFQQRLVELGIGWCAYCKFGIQNNSLIPLVSGKSGSMLVNISGHDLSFSKDLDHGPARQYLNNNYLNWYEKAIIIIPSNSEIESLNIENYLHKFGFPFGS